MNKYVVKLVKMNIVAILCVVMFIAGCGINKNVVTLSENEMVISQDDYIPVSRKHAMDGYDISFVYCTHIDYDNGISYFIDDANRLYTYIAIPEDMCVGDFYTVVYDRETLTIGCLRYERPDLLYDLID